MKKLIKRAFFAATLCAVITIFSSTARAETTQCTPITTIPITITTQGIYCLNGNLAGNLASGEAILIETNNVTIDLNGYKLGNLAAGASTGATGIYSYQKKNITIRNGTIRGFQRGIQLSDANPYTTSSGHLIEDVRMDGNTYLGIYVLGTGSVIRNNQAVRTGGSTVYLGALGIAAYGNGTMILNNDVIDVAGSSSNTYGIYVSWGDGTVVEGNRISNVSTTSSTSYGISLNITTNVTVSDNRIAGATNYGVYYNSGASGIYMNNTVSGSATPFFGGSVAGTTNYSN